MLKLRPGFIFFLTEVILSVVGFVFIVYSVINNPTDWMTETGVLYGIFIIAVAAIMFTVKFIWRSKHTLRFNTKQFVVKGTTYTYDQIEKFDMGGLENKSSNIYMFVDGKEVFHFTRRYQNFFEFKAVLKEHEIELGYY